METNNSKFHEVIFDIFFNPIWAGLWNDVVDWGGALSARIQFLEGSPFEYFWQRSEKKIFWDFSGTCLTLKKTKSRNLVSVAQSTWTRQTIFGDPGRKCPPPSLDRVNL